MALPLRRCLWLTGKDFSQNKIHNMQIGSNSLRRGGGSEMLPSVPEKRGSKLVRLLAGWTYGKMREKPFISSFCWCLSPSPFAHLGRGALPVWIFPGADQARRPSRARGRVNLPESLLTRKRRRPWVEPSSQRGRVRSAASGGEGQQHLPCPPAGALQVGAAAYWASRPGFVA